jgi:transcription elongation factor GreA-like protein
MVTAAISALVFVVVYRKAPFKTYRAKIYTLLAKYDPVDTTAYARLQEKATDNDVLLDDIFVWLLTERAAVIGDTHLSEADLARSLFAVARKEIPAVIDLRSRR